MNERKNGKINNFFQRIIYNLVMRYNHKKYWNKREYVVNNSKKNMLKKYIYLIQVKRTDSYHCCSFGTDINSGAQFDEPPRLPHGPNGIIISHKSQIGKNVTIYHQVTFGEKNGRAPKICDNCIIYPGAKIIGGVLIGEGSIVAPNSVVINDIPKNSVVSGVPAVLIKSKIK